jgi:hypothetical protein
MNNQKDITLINVGFSNSGLFLTQMGPSYPTKLGGG